jgi:hypothetical protein
VRYDRSLPAAAKMLYCEITALTHKTGYCWAGNAYFANLYKTTERTIINWIGALRRQGYIRLFYTYVPGKKEIQSRTIRICEPPDPPAPANPPRKPAGAPAAPDPGQAPQQDPAAPADPPQDSACGPLPGDEEIFTPCAPPQEPPEAPDPRPTPQQDPPAPDPARPAPPPPEVVKKFSPRGEEIFTTSGKNLHHVVKNFSKGGEEIFMDNIIINNINTSTSSPDPPPAKKEEEAASIKNPETGPLKALFAKIDPRLVFDPAFYPRAASYLARRGYGQAFLAWLYDFCCEKNPRSLAGLYYSLFFSEQAAELYALSLRQRSPPPPEPILCSVCGREHPEDGKPCPGCGLPYDCSPETLAWHKRFFRLPEDRKTSFSREQEALMSSRDINMAEKLRRHKQLLAQYGLARQGSA